MGKATPEDISNLVASTASTYATNKIVILGKGPSADDVSPAVFKDAVVIGLNDAERIADADITIFHEEWALNAVKDAGLRSRAYVTSLDADIPDRTVIKLDYEPLTNDTADLMMIRFQDRSDLAVEEVMLLTALELARLIADERGADQDVYLVGFDFTLEKGYSRAANTSHNPAATTSRKAGVDVQEYVLRNAMYALRDTNLNVKHIGTFEF